MIRLGCLCLCRPHLSAVMVAAVSPPTTATWSATPLLAPPASWRLRLWSKKGKHLPFALLPLPVALHLPSDICQLPLPVRDG